MHKAVSLICQLFPGLLLLPAVAAADADLVLSASSTPSPIVINNTTYVYATVANFGADEAQDVMVTSSLAPSLNLVRATATQGNCTGVTTVICNLGTIASGNLSVQATVTLEVTASSTGSINNNFSITSSTIDSDLSNNVATATVEIVAVSDSADLSVAYSMMANWVYQSVSTTFPLVIVNNGPAGTGQVQLNFGIPQLTLTSFISATPSQGICTTALTNCAGIACVMALQLPISMSCELGALSSGGLATVDIVVTAAGDVGDILHSSTVVQDSTTADADSNNNSSTASVEIIATPTIEGGAGPGGCFIATAAYGSAMADDVQRLREFRDNHLLPTVWGRKFVSAYYNYSPPVAQYISEHEKLRTTVRWMLAVPVTIIRFPMSALVVILCLALLAAWLVLRRRARPGSASIVKH